MRCGRKGLEEKLMIPGLCGIVVDRTVGREDDIFEGLVGEGRIYDQRVEFVHVSHVMFVMVITHGLLGDLRFEGIVSIGQFLRRETRKGCGVGGCHKR